MRLWYDRPAFEWSEALPIGNGRLGAMVFGHYRHSTRASEILALNEETVWHRNERRDRLNPAGRQHLATVRRLLLAGRVEEAQHLARVTMLSCPREQSPYQPLGEVHLTFTDHDRGRPNDYARDLDLDAAVAHVRYALNGVRHIRSCFASAADNVIVLRLESAPAQRIDFHLHLTRRPFNGITGRVDGRTVRLCGKAGPRGVEFAACARAVTRDGSVRVMGDNLVVRRASAATILIAANTDFHGHDPLRLCREQLEAASRKPYDRLLAAHVREHRRLFRRLTLELGGSAAEPVPTDRRLERVRHGRCDPGLEALVFHYGRYLLLSSSRPGTLPANLQGLWNDLYTPPWESKYTLNINTQMNYWPAEPCGLPECHEPFLTFVERLARSGRTTARRLYGCRGFVVHHNSDAWADTAPVGELLSAAVWPAGGAWAALHLWEHFEFTLDRRFLRERAYPVLKSAARFFLDYLAADGRGRLLSGPSVSPENGYRLSGGGTGYLCMGPSMDHQICRALFEATEQAARLVGTDLLFRQELAAAREKLPPTRIGRHGQIMEWLEDHEEAAPGHRHLSHLFDLHPGHGISPEATPDLARAAFVSIERRLRHGSGHTGWSRAWIVNLLARLHKGNEAHAHLREFLRHSLQSNLFSTHPPFQIDGNFGVAAGMAEMLLQSRISPGRALTAPPAVTIWLLPALPKAWPAGRVTGLRARGGIEVDIVWRRGGLDSAVLRASRRCRCLLRYKERAVTCELNARTACRLTATLKVLCGRQED
jgi:alpha-L-fucosidase 2